MTGTVTHGFEIFELTDPACEDPPSSIWLMFGGLVSSGTIYCCPGEGDAARRKSPLMVEGIPMPLVEDAMFEQFQRVIQRKEQTAMRATLVGTFFAGETAGRTSMWGSYGHLGCCSLFVIERVERFEEALRR